MPEVVDRLLGELAEALGKDEKPSISIKEAAALAGVDVETLRVAISNGSCPFGYGGQHRDSGTRFGRVSKLALWAFMTKGVYDMPKQGDEPMDQMIQVRYERERQHE